MRTEPLGVAALMLGVAACAGPIPHPPSCPADCSRGTTSASVHAPVASAVVHRRGLSLEDEAGRPLTLRGVNLGGWLLWEGWIWGAKIRIWNTWGHAQSALEERLADAAGSDALCRFRQEVRDRFITEADIAAISAAGFNVVRIPLNHRDFACDTSPGWEALDRVLAWCEAHHVYAVLDLHSAPGGQTQYFISDPEPVLLWDSAEAQDRTVRLWRAIASRYAGRASVAGYDLLNEPSPHHGADLAALYRRILDAIREVDPAHLVILEGSDYARDFSMFTAPLDPNQIYSFHMYTWFGDDRRKRLAGYAKVASAQGVPMWCGEFGENTVPMISTTLDLFDGATPVLAGWSFWTWKRGASSRWATLHGIVTPPGWQRLIDWAVNDQGPEPAPLEAQRSMSELLDAADMSRVRSNEDLGRVLSEHARH